MPDAPTTSSAGRGGIRPVLALPLFRRLWQCLALASLADWVGLLAVTAYANALAGDDAGSRNVAIAGVLFVRLLPALVVGPLGGYVADRLDRRTTLVGGLTLRAALFTSMPLVGTLSWLVVATLLVEAVNVVWLPTKDALVPDLVSREQLEDGNRLNLATSYGAALPAAVVFTGLSSLAELLGARWPAVSGAPAELSMYVDTVLLLAAAALAYTLRGLPPVAGGAVDDSNVITTIVQGWVYVARTRSVRGLVLGIVGAFAAGGVVIGLARVYVSDLGAGDPGYGVLFGAVFLGLATGMWWGPRAFARVPRSRLFGRAIIAAGVSLGAFAVSPRLEISVVLAVLVGLCAGLAWIVGYTLLGLGVAEAVRGRTFAFVQSAVRLTLAGVLAVAPLVAAAIGSHRFPDGTDGGLTYSGAQLTLGLAALVFVVAGVGAQRQMDERGGSSGAR